jgi:hypothetical protein
MAAGGSEVEVPISAVPFSLAAIIADNEDATRVLGDTPIST